MHDIYDLTLDVITQYLRKERFSMTDLEKSIHQAGAPMRVAPTYTVREYLNELQWDGIIEFQPKHNSYSKVIDNQNHFNYSIMK